MLQVLGPSILNEFHLWEKTQKFINRCQDAKSNDPGNNVVQVSDLEKQLHDQKDEIAKLQATVAQLKTEQIQNKSVRICCTVCNKPPGIYPCKKCSRVFSCQDSLDTHFKTVHAKHFFEKIVTEDKAFNAKTNKFECEICKKSYRLFEHLTQHLKNPPKIHGPEEQIEKKSRK